MELGKYIKAMRPKKYMTKDFVVYRAPVEESMTPQLESPQTFAGGGVVQREGFGKGGFSKFKYKTLEEFETAIQEQVNIINAENFFDSNNLAKKRIAEHFGYKNFNDIDPSVKKIVNDNLIRTETKVKNHLTNILNDLHNIPYDDIVNAGGFTKYISEPFGFSNRKRVSNLLTNDPDFKAISNLSQRLSGSNTLKNYSGKDLLVADVLNQLDIKKTGVFNKGSGFGYKIGDIVDRSIKAGNKDIKFVKGYELGRVDDKNVLFEMDGKIYGVDPDFDKVKGRNVINVNQFGESLPEFQKIKNAYEQANVKANKPVVFNGKETTYGDLLKETYAKGYGKDTYYKQNPFEVDHLNIKNAPFDDVRVLPRHINQTAGSIKNTASIFTPEAKEKALNKIGYNIPDEAIDDSIVKFADRVINKKQQLNTPYETVKRYLIRPEGADPLYKVPPSDLTFGDIRSDVDVKRKQSYIKGQSYVDTSSGPRPVSPKEKIGIDYERIQTLADRIKNDANFKDVSLTMYPKCKTVKMASAGSPGDSQIVCLAESLMADSDKIKNARNATERLVPESRFRQILTKAGESKPGKFIKWLELGVELPIEGLLVGWDVAFNGTPLKEAVAGNTLFAKAVMGWPSQEKMFEEKVIQNNPAAKFYLEAKKDQARYNELTDSIKNAENDLLAEADLGTLYKKREELLASAKSKYFDADKKFSYMDALKPGSYFQNEYQKAEAEIQSNRIQSLNKKLGSLEGDTESFFGAQQLQQGIEERSLDIQKELIKQYDPTQAEYGAMVKNYLKEIEDKAYKENKKKKGEDLLFDKRVEMYLDKILKSAYEEKYHNFFGQQYQTGGRVGFSTGGAKALWDKMIKFILKNKNRINEVFSTTADQITENSLKQLAEKEPERLKNVYNKLFTHINTTKGEAPKTNLPKVRARVEKEKERFAEAVKEWDEKEMNEAYKNIEHRMTGEDYKYEAQELADELSQVRYKTDFYDLDQKLQLDLYDEAYNFLMEGKRQKAERYKNIKIIGDEEASAMAKTLKEKDPEGYKNIEKIVDDKNTSETGMFDDLFDRMYSEYEYSKFKDKGRKPNADGGRVGLSDGDDPYNLKSKLPRPENTIPINPELEVKDPSKRSFLKGMGVAGVGLAAAGMGLLKSKALSKKAIKVAEEITSKVDNMPFDVWAEILYQAKQHGRVLSKPFDASDAYQFKNPNVVGKGGKYELKIDLPDVGKKHVEVEEFVDGSIGITYERADGTPNSIYFQRGERQYRTNPDVQIGPEGEPTGPIGSFHEVSPPTVEHGYGYWTRDQKFEMDISSINDGLKDDPIGAHIMKYFDDKFKSRSKDPKSVNKIKEKSNFKSHNELEPDIPDEGYIP